MRASVIGLGKLGAPLAAVLASKGFRVVGSDVDHAFVDAINAGRAPVDEPHLQELIDEHRDRLSAKADAAAAVAQTDITFIIVPTPSDETGRFSNRFVLSAIERVGAGLRQKAGYYHVVVVTSTVMPGSMEAEVHASLEAHSGRRVGAEIGLCYNPLFVALGSVVRDLLTPEMILIGESDQKAGDVLAHIYGTICDSRPLIHRMTFVNAELAKIAVNTFVTTKISYANMLADVCDRLPGADVDIVTQAVGSDSRIGRKSLRAAIGYGGPCFPRDNAAFAALARSLGARAELAESTDSLNRYQIERVLGAVVARLGNGGPVGVLGLGVQTRYVRRRTEPGCGAGRAPAAGRPPGHRLRSEGARAGAVGRRQAVHRGRVCRGLRPALLRGGADDAMAGVSRHRDRGVRPTATPPGRRLLAAPVSRKGRQRRRSDLHRSGDHLRQYGERLISVSSHG